MKYLVRIVSGFSLLLPLVITTSAIIAKLMRRPVLITSLPVAAHLLSFPFVMCAVLAVIGIVLAFATVWKRRTANPQRFHALTSLGCIVTALMYGSLLLGPTQGATASQPTQHSVAVLEWNAQESANSKQFADMFRRFNPKVLVLPEFGNHPTSTGTKVTDLLRDAGEDPEAYSTFTSTSRNGIAPVTVIVKRSLGAYTAHHSDLGSFGSIVLNPANAHTQLPTIIGVHTAPPLPGLMKD